MTCLIKLTYNFGRLLACFDLSLQDEIGEMISSLNDVTQSYPDVSRCPQHDLHRHLSMGFLPQKKEVRSQSVVSSAFYFYNQR
jgi:hypothetical protein